MYDDSDTDSSAGSGRGRKASSKRGRGYRKNGKNGFRDHHRYQNGVGIRKNGYASVTAQKNSYHHNNRDQPHTGVHTRGGDQLRTAMATSCHEGKADDSRRLMVDGDASGWGSGSDGPGPRKSNQAVVARKRNRTSSRASDGTGSADEGVPSHVGLVHAVLSHCASGYDSGSVGDGTGGPLARSPRASPLHPPPVNSDGLPPPRIPDSHALCASDVEQMSTAVNAPESLPGDADSQKSLDLSESQADQSTQIEMSHSTADTATLTRPRKPTPHRLIRLSILDIRIATRSPAITLIPVPCQTATA